MDESNFKNPNDGSKKQCHSEVFAFKVWLTEVRHPSLWSQIQGAERALLPVEALDFAAKVAEGEPVYEANGREYVYGGPDDVAPDGVRVYWLQFPSYHLQAQDYKIHVR